MVRKAVSAACIALFVLLAGCSAVVKGSLFPAYLQNADKTVSLTDFIDLEGLSFGRDYSIQMRSLEMTSGDVFLGVQVFFTDSDILDTLLIFTSDLRYVKSYDRDSFSLSPDHDMSYFLAPAADDKILIGFYESADDTLSKIVVFDPTGRTPPAISAETAQDAVPNDYRVPAFLVPSESGYDVLRMDPGRAVIKINSLDASYAPGPETREIQVFQNTGTSGRLLDLYHDASTATNILLLRGGSQGYAVFIPAANTASPVAPIVGSYPYRIYSGIYNNQCIFLTKDGVVVSREDNEAWRINKFDGSTKEGPLLAGVNVDDYAWYFSQEGSRYYLYDSRRHELYRLRTWW
jgi:hypothetical protein